MKPSISETLNVVYEAQAKRIAVLEAALREHEWCRDAASDTPSPKPKQCGWCFMSWPNHAVRCHYVSVLDDARAALEEA